jgi:hypothetical protein
MADVWLALNPLNQKNQWYYLDKGIKRHYDDTKKTFKLYMINMYSSGTGYD